MKRILPLLFLITTIASFAQTNIGGTYSTNETLTLANSPYTVTSSITVNAGVTLTIESGAILNFNDNLTMTVNGVIDADGIIFTSSNASPIAGSWVGLTLNGDNTNTLTNCQVLYARTGVNINRANIDISGSSFTTNQNYGVYSDNSVAEVRNAITANNVTISGAGAYGIYIDRADLDLSNSAISGVTGAYAIYFDDNQTAGEAAVSSSTVSNTTISDGTTAGIALGNGNVAFTDITVSNSQYPVSYLGSANATYAGTTSFTNNDFDVIIFATASVTRDMSLPDAGYLYYFNGTKTINNGAELTIASGVLIKMSNSAILNVKGKLTADAAPGETITFTSWHDDNVVGDSNGDSNDTSPDNTEWSGIHFQNESDDTSLLDGLTLKWTRYYGAITTYDASPTISNNSITNCYYGAMFNGASSPSFSNNIIAASEQTPIAMTLDANPIFSNNAFSSSDNEYDAIGLLGSVLTRDNVLPQRNFTDIDNVTYVLLGSVDIPVGTSLTINPGVVIKVQSGQNIEVQGELIADGNIADGPIVFTSINDDNYGNPLDTRNDGTDAIPAIGNFGGIYFGENAESTSLIDSVLIKFANYAAEYQRQAPPEGGTRVFYYQSAIAINQSEPTISNTEISDANYGIDMRGLSSPVLTSNEIKNTSFAPFRQAIQSTPVYSGNTFSSVGWKGVAILPELINYTATLSKQTVAGFDNILYIITDLDINETAEITIEDGIFIKMDANNYIEVFGGLNIAGTAESPVTITTLADDNTGPFTNPLDNDTEGNGNATDPTTRKWGSIIFYEMSDDAFSNISHTNLLYGGVGNAPIWWKNAAASVGNVEISFSQNYGLYFEGASTPTVDNVSISTSRLDPLAMSYFADPIFNNITFNANGSNGIRLIDTQLNADATIAKRDIAGISNIGYIMSDLNIGNGATLTINPGVVLKLSSNDIEVNEGSIQAIGTPAEKIIFTSLKDDSRGGDTNIDGNGSSPAPGDWFGIVFRESTIQSNLQYAEFRYGGDALYFGGIESTKEGTIISENNNLSVDNCIIQLSTSSGFGVYGTSTASFTNNQLENVARFPVHLSMFSNPTFSGNTMENVAWFALGIQSESYNQSATFPFRSFAGVDSVTYYPTQYSSFAMTINSGTKITVPAGMHFKTLNESIFEVNGELHIAGTAEDPVVFTDFKDDDYGRPRDTENNGLPTSNIIGYGKVFDFNNISNDASLVEHTIIRYKDRAATLESASPTFDNNLMEYSAWGVTSTGISEPVYINNTFKDLDFAPFATSLVAYPTTTSGNVLEGTTWKAIQINNETLTQDTTLYKRSFAGISNIPYTFNNYTVGLGVKMTIESGVILKFSDLQPATSAGNSGALLIKGALEANGGPNSDETIIFTSMEDDFYGGDTNADSTYSTNIFNEWDGITFTNESSDSESILSNVIIKGATNYGVELQSASPTITNTLFWENGRDSNDGGLYITGASNPTLANNDFVDNSFFSGTIKYGFGISNTGTFTVDATGSWWGSNAGPYIENSNPEGDIVLGNVTFDPWATDNSLNPITGDVSLNGTVSAYDAALTLQQVATIITFNARQTRAGDVSGDGTVSAMDASYILQFAAGIIQSFPAEAENKRTDEDFVSTHSEVILAIGNGDINSAYGEVSLPITVSNVKELYALSMSLPLGDHLSFSEFKVNEELTFSPTIHFNEMENEFNLAFGLMNGLKEDFVLGTLTLSLNAERVPVSSITLVPNDLVGNETDISSTAEAGQVYIAGAVLGNSELKNGISIYPNPTVSHAIVSMPELTQEEVNVQVIDVSGKLMMYGQKPIGENKLVLSNLQLNPGIYIIRVVGETKQFEQQLIISQ